MVSVAKQGTICSDGAITPVLANRHKVGIIMPCATWRIYDIYERNVKSQIQKNCVEFRMIPDHDVHDSGRV